MNKEELKALRKRLGDYLIQLVNNDKEISGIDWKAAHVWNIEIYMVIISLLLQEGDQKKEGKADKIRATVKEITIALEFEWAAHKSGFKFDSSKRAELEKELDELLKDL